MADLFVSYSSEDRDYVRVIVAELESQGWTVWWDRDIEVGSSFDKTIEKAIDDTLCIVVIWSATSVDSDWVRAEAAEGLQRNILVPVLLDDVKPPLLFRQKQAISLVEWKNAEKDSAPPLATLFPTIRTKLDQDQNSSLPFSTQVSWLLDNVEDESINDRVIGPALYEGLKLGLGFLEDAFVYPGDMSQDSGTVVRNEGLDGLVRLAVEPEGTAFRLTLNIENAKTRTVEAFRSDKSSRDDLIMRIGDLLIQSAKSLQGAAITFPEKMLSFLSDRNLESLYYMNLGHIEEKARRWDKVKENFGKSIELDPEFSRARGGFSLACRYLGQLEESKSNMTEAIGLLEKDCPRDRHYFRAMYHFMVTEDAEQAGLEFQEVIKLSPLDRSAMNNLAICKFQQLDFSAACELSSRDLQLYPFGAGRLENAALFALYSGDFEAALGFYDRSVDSDDAALVRHLIPVLVTSIIEGPLAGLDKLLASDIQNTYSDTAAADLTMAMQDWPNALRYLEKGIESDTVLENFEQSARKILMKAEVLFFSGDNNYVNHLEHALSLCDSTETLASASILILRCESGPIGQVGKLLKSRVDKRSRAYAKMTVGIAQYLEGDIGEAIEQIKAGIAILDLWLIRYCLAHIFQKAGLNLDSNDQFSVCARRSGEGVFALLDDIVTYRYLHHAKASLG